VTLPTYNVGGAADKRRQFGKEGKTHVGTRQSREEKQEDVELKSMVRLGLFCWVGFSRKDRHGGTWSKFPPSHLYVSKTRKARKSEFTVVIHPSNEKKGI
jgi:hypothetical protein